MTISKRCDVPSCFLFVVVAGHVCVCVRVLGASLYRIISPVISGNRLLFAVAAKSF